MNKNKACRLSNFFNHLILLLILALLNACGSGEDDSDTPSPDITISESKLVWAKQAGGTNTERGAGIASFADGSSVVTGDFGGTITFGAGEVNEVSFTSVGNSVDSFIARYNSAGSLLWAKQIGGSSLERGYDVAGLPDNSSVVVGSFTDTLTLGVGEPNETTLTSLATQALDIYIARYNDDGTLAWAKSIGGSVNFGNVSRANAVATFSDGGSVVTGQFYGATIFGAGEPGETTLTASGYLDIFVARYNPDGTLAWAKQAGSSSKNTVDVDSGIGISTLTDGSSVVTGSFTESAIFGIGEVNETTLTVTAFTDLFIARYNADGTLAWARKAGGSGRDKGNSVAVFSDGSSVVVGFNTDSITFGSGEANETTFITYRNFIARYNANGTLAWAKPTESQNLDVASFQDNRFAVTGLMENTATFGLGEANEITLTSAGSRDIFIARYNANGTLASVKKTGGTTEDIGYSIATYLDQTAVVTGVFSSTAIFGAGEANEISLISTGSSDVFVAKFSHLQMFTLNVTSEGLGQGTMTSSPTGIACGLDCQSIHSENSVVMLTATPAGGSAFAGWSGDPDCTDGSVAMTNNLTCIANFDLIAAENHVLSVTNNGTGTGTVSSDPVGINCGVDCDEVYFNGTVVSLTATPNAGSKFAGWTGDTDCSDGVVTMLKASSCIATFLIDTTLTSFEDLSLSQPNIISPFLFTSEAYGVAVFGYSVHPEFTSWAVDSNSRTGNLAINVIPNGNPNTDLAATATTPISSALLNIMFDVSASSSATLDFWVNSTSNPRIASVHNCDSGLSVYYRLDGGSWNHKINICGQHKLESTGWRHVSLVFDTPSSTSIEFAFEYDLQVNPVADPSVFYVVDDLTVTLK